MKCIDNPLSEEELFAALDSEADIEVQSHLQQCAYCRKRLGEIERFERRLRGGLHPNSQVLLDYSFGLLTETESVPIRDHISGCKNCQATLAEFEIYKHEEPSSLKRTVPLTSPKTRRLKPGELIKELIAVFIPQDQVAVATLGNTTNSFVAEASGIKLFLHTEHVEKTFLLSGQVVADDQATWEGAVAILTHQNTSEAGMSSALLNDLGQFSYKPVSAGTYKLRIVSLSYVAITLYNLELS
jgi:hypothetical protein